MPPLREPVARLIGLAAVTAYAVIIASLFITQPRSVVEAVGGMSATLGTYQIDQRAFNDGLKFFRNDQFAEARAAFARADPAGRDATTQFYIAYAFYRHGWRRTHSDDVLFSEGLKAVDRAIALAPDHRLDVDDPGLLMRTADELKAELQEGLTRDASDFNPGRLFRSRK